jgi:hypothetical protein
MGFQDKGVKRQISKQKFIIALRWKKPYNDLEESST